MSVSKTINIPGSAGPGTIPSDEFPPFCVFFKRGNADADDGSAAAGQMKMRFLGVFFSIMRFFTNNFFEKLFEVLRAYHQL